MGQQYDNEKKGVLFPNDNRRDDKDPTMRGQCEIDGVQYWVDAWTNVGKPGSKVAGKKFLSLKFRPKDDQPTREREQPAQRDEDIPW